MSPTTSYPRQCYRRRDRRLGLELVHSRRARRPRQGLELIYVRGLNTMPDGARAVGRHVACGKGGRVRGNGVREAVAATLRRSTQSKVVLLYAFTRRADVAWRARHAERKETCEEVPGISIAPYAMYSSRRRLSAPASI